MRKILSIREKFGPFNPSFRPIYNGAKLVGRLRADDGVDDAVFSLKYNFDYEFAIEFYQPYPNGSIAVYADILKSEDKAEEADRLKRAEKLLAFFKTGMLADELAEVDNFANVEYSDSMMWH